MLCSMQRCALPRSAPRCQRPRPAGSVPRRCPASPSRGQALHVAASDSQNGRELDAVMGVLLEMKEQQSSFQHQLSAVQQQVSAVQVQQGRMVEMIARPDVGRMFGGGYERQLAALSLQDLVQLLPSEQVPNPSSPVHRKDSLLLPLELARRAAKQLVVEQVPRQLLDIIWQRLRASDPSMAESVFDGSGRLQASILGSFLGQLKDEPLKEALVRLRRAVQLSEPEQEEELLGCQSAGIMCAVAAAFPQAYLQQWDSISDSSKLFPPRELEFDFRGRINVGQNFAFIDIGEGKLGLDYTSAVEQLGVRLGVLRWLVESCCGVPRASIICAGRMFVCGGESSGGVDALQQQLARELWGYSLYMHHM